jgi:hypothetical protein
LVQCTKKNLATPGLKLAGGQKRNEKLIFVRQSKTIQGAIHFLKLFFSTGTSHTIPGTDVIILKIFSQKKNCEKIGDFDSKQS